MPGKFLQNVFVCMMASLDAIDICAIVSTTLNVFILFPYLIYALNQFNKNSNKQLMRYRNKKLIYIINGHVIFMIFIWSPWILCVRIWRISPTWPIWTEWFPIAIGSNLSFILLFLKIYLLYFEQQFNVSIVRQTLEEYQKYNFWIHQRNKLGNLWFLLLAVFTPYIIFSTLIYCLLYLQNLDILFDAFQAIMAFIELSLCIFIYHKVCTIQ